MAGCMLQFLQPAPPGVYCLAVTCQALALALKRTQWARHFFHSPCPGFKSQPFTASSRAVGLWHSPCEPQGSHL